MPLTKQFTAATGRAKTSSHRAKGRPRFQVPGPAGLDVRSFCRAFHLRQDLFARLSGYSLRAVAGWAAGKPISASSAQRLTEIRRLCDALSRVVKSDRIGRWLQMPNDAFDGSTPVQVIERGEVDRLWRMVYRLESGEPG